MELTILDYLGLPEGAFSSLDFFFCRCRSPRQHSVCTFGADPAPESLALLSALQAQRLR